jgi:Uroporphyrinogen decarboxylase (URO-D)
MTSEEKRAWRIERWRNPDIQWSSPEAEAEYKARVDRMVAAIRLDKPDRVPIHLDAGFWPAHRAGLSPYEAMSHAQRAAKAWKEFNLKFQPDSSVDPLESAIPGRALAALEYALYSWPGHGVPEDAGYQYNEKEWMAAEDYDHLISDPTDYLLRTYLPRTVGAFAGFAGLSPFLDYIELPFVSSQVMGWGSDEMIASLEKLTKAARIFRDWADIMVPAIDEVMALGFPHFAGSSTKAPFDILGDTLRGTKAIATDLFRRPDKVLAACDRLVHVAIDWPLKRPGVPDTPICAIPLHKGADGFMSDDQFRTFYWPTLKRLIEGLVEEGMIPLLFAEGRYSSRLEAIMETPRGSSIWLFDQTDMAHAKETIGTVCCIQGNVPLSLLQVGEAAEVARYTRQLIDTAAKDGGFILDVGAAADAGKDENLAAMIDTAKEYGVY